MERVEEEDLKIIISDEKEKKWCRNESENKEKKNQERVCISSSSNSVNAVLVTQIIK